MDEEEFLYLNWRSSPPVSDSEIEEIFIKAEKQRLAQNSKNEKTVSQNDLDDWDLSGDIYDCIKRYSDRLGEAELNEILAGLEAGLTQKQVKSYFCLSADKMSQYRRAYMFGNVR